MPPTPSVADVSETRVESSADLPEGVPATSVVRFFLEYGTEHPLWLADGDPELDDLQLDRPLAERLRRWSDYWDRTFHWEDGWPPGTPEPWWDAEGDALPRDLAIALGPDFVIHDGVRYLRSTSPARVPEAAAAVSALERAAQEEADEVAAQLAAGATFTVRPSGVRRPPGQTTSPHASSASRRPGREDDSADPACEDDS